jgi:hypothetical protein
VSLPPSVYIVRIEGERKEGGREREREGGRAYLLVERTQRGGEGGDAYPSSHQQ